MTPPWRIRYYVSEDGTIPFKDFIGRLKSRRERAACGAVIKLLNLLEMSNGRGHLTHTNGLCEFQVESVRIFYVYDSDDDVIVVIDGLLPGDGQDRFDAIRRKAEDYASYG